MRGRARVGALVTCVALSACNPTTPSPASSGALDGQWSGTTAQSVPITFSVAPSQKVTAISVGYSFNGCSGIQTYSNLSLETAPTVICIPGPCSNDISSFRSFNYLAGSPGGPTTTINGLFVLGSRAEGQVSFRDYPGCGTAAGIAWTAVRQ
jgi:hypothetical protein